MWYSYIGRVLRRPRYALLALSIAAVVFTVAIWLQNWRLVAKLMGESTAPVTAKLHVVLSLYGAIGTNFSLLAAVYTILMAVLLGINLALLVHYVRAAQQPHAPRSAAASLGGLVSGVLGMGCAACGTFVLSGTLTLVGASSVAWWLPLHGEEFGLLGVALLAYATYRLAKQGSNPALCPVEKGGQ